jgi:TRAP-type C4-dicarboxylate transport system substrate-binding protein
MRSLLSRIATGVAVVLVSASAHAATTLTLHTPGPSEGAWGKVFRAWSNVVAKKTDGAVQLRPVFDGKLGTEPDVIERVKKGEAGGGFFTTRGLAELDKSVLALQVRGAYGSWGEFDAARGHIESDLIASWQRQHVVLVGWSDVGIGRFMSRGFAITNPASLANKRVAVFDGDVITPKLMEAITGGSTVPLGANAILRGLEHDEVDAVAAPAYAAEQLGWTARLDHINTRPLFFAAGAVVVSDRLLEPLTDEQKALVLSTGKRAAAMLDKKLDSLGFDSYNRLKSKLKTDAPSAADRKAWDAVFKEACNKLDGTIPKSALEKTHACH